uniref:SFRICE_031767 n=1 Tax=Spodoptera frugiperda TaxID=7108 RepID=A0A2H1VL76_SPOFR
MEFRIRNNCQASDSVTGLIATRRSPRPVSWNTAYEYEPLACLETSRVPRQTFIIAFGRCWD